MTEISPKSSEISQKSSEISQKSPNIPQEMNQDNIDETSDEHLEIVVHEDIYDTAAANENHPSDQTLGKTYKTPMA